MHPGRGTAGVKVFGFEVHRPRSQRRSKKDLPNGTPMSGGSREICLRRFSAMTRTTMPLQFPPAWRVARLRHRYGWIPTRSSKNSA
jgi:hypothetical protein